MKQACRNPFLLSCYIIVPSLSIIIYQSWFAITRCCYLRSVQELLFLVTIAPPFLHVLSKAAFNANSHPAVSGALLLISFAYLRAVDLFTDFEKFVRSELLHSMLYEEMHVINAMVSLGVVMEAAPCNF